MKRALALALFALTLSALPARAQSCSGLPVLRPFAAEAITVSSTAIGFTAATYETGTVTADLALVTLETNPIRYRVDGSDPTSAVGHLLTTVSAVNPYLLVCGRTAIRNFKAIRTGSDAALYVTYFRGP